MPLLSATRHTPSEARMIDLYARPHQSAVITAADEVDACDREIIAAVGPANAAHHVVGIITLRMAGKGDETKCSRSSDTPHKHITPPGSLRHAVAGARSNTGHLFGGKKAVPFPVVLAPRYAE